MFLKESLSQYPFLTNGLARLCLFMISAPKSLCCQMKVSIPMLNFFIKMLFRIVLQVFNVVNEAVREKGE